MMNSYFGIYGGCFAPETLVNPLLELTAAYKYYSKQAYFQKELNHLLSDFVGRPTPLTFANRLTHQLNGAQIYFKREDLAHTGAHKINNALAQALLAVKMGKKRIIAETGAGQHGVATATACAKFGLKCVVYMGEIDMERQALNVTRMRLLGAEIRPVTAGRKTLKEATSEAMRDWVTNVTDTYYIIGSALGPHPYPTIVRDFQKIIGIEARRQILELTHNLPDLLIACVGGGSNAIGLFYPFLEDKSVNMIGVEAGGLTIKEGKHAARFASGTIGVLQGSKTYLLQDENGQILPTHSISAGLDYPAVGPEHAFYHDLGRIKYTYATDQEAIEATHLISRVEGILPALETAHALAELIKIAPAMKQNQTIIVNISGRGDKDVETLSEVLKQ